MVLGIDRGLGMRAIADKLVLSFGRRGAYSQPMASLQESTVVIDWTGCPLVEINPRKLSGVPVLRGTRMPADGVMENYRDGMPAQEIAEVFELPVHAVCALLAYAVDQDPALRR